MEVFILFIAIVFIITLIAKSVSSSSTNNYDQANSHSRDNLSHVYQKPTVNLEDNFDASPETIDTTVSKDQETQSTFTIRVGITSNNSYLPKTKDSKWIKKNELISIQGYDINSGLIYVGEWLPSENYTSTCQSCLINPKLRIDKSNPDYFGNSLSYWPSYSEITPQARAAYLTWLATCKNEPNISIGYVFLYFYGLERRLLIDLEKDTNENNIERDEILIEIKRLLDIYKSSSSFKSYATNLLVFSSALYKKNFSLLLEHDNERVYGEYPLHFKLLLADYALNQKPLGHDIALKWLEYDPFTYLRTPSKRCKKEFDSIFEIKFRKKYGEGIYIKPNKTQITITYKPASGSLNRNFEKKLEYPDITKLTKYIEQFRIIAQECENELDAYSRYLGKKPDNANSFVGLSMLPKELLNSKAIKPVETIKEDLKSKIEKNVFAFIDASYIMKLMGMNATKLSKNEVVAIVQFLSKIDIGIEPDIRFCNQLLKPEDKTIIFSITEEFPSTPSREYSATSTLVAFAVSISLADGNFSVEERDYIVQHVESSLKLTKPELVRITAYMDWLSTSANQIKGLSPKVKNLSNDHKEQLIRFLLTLSNVDGYVSPEEIKSLKKIYRLFEFSEEKIYSDIHSIQTNTSNLATIIPSQVNEDGYAVPKEKEQIENLNLNEKIIEQTLRDTYKIKEILTNIFEEEDQKEEPPSSNIDAESYNSTLGLDQQHWVLFNRLIKKDNWGQIEYEALCNELNILPEGAIETLNQFFFDKYGDDLILVDQDLEINRSLLKNEPTLLMY